MLQTEMRALPAQDNQPSRITGYAALYNSLSEVFWGMWQERIAPGAFDNALTKSDIRCLFNHDQNIVLGRESSKTLKCVADAKGLNFDNTPPDTQVAKDLLISIQRGDVSQCSFAFTIAENGDTWEETADGLMLRTITEFDQIYDVSPVTYPAYPDTSAQVRSMVSDENVDIERLTDIAKRHKSGTVLSDKEKEFIKQAFTRAKKIANEDPQQVDDGQEKPFDRLILLRKRVGIYEKCYKN